MAEFETGVEISIEASRDTGAISVASEELRKFSDEVGKTQGRLDQLVDKHHGEALAEDQKRWEAQLRGVRPAAEEASTATKLYQEANDALNSSIAQLVGAAAIGAFFKSAVEESLKEAEALRVLQGTIQGTQGGYEGLKNKVDAFTASQQASTRFDDTVTIEVLGKMQRATGNLAQAMAATALAQDIASGSGKDLAETTALVNGLLTGQERSVKLAQKEFSAYIGTADTTQGVLDALSKGFTGAAESEQSWTKNLDQSKHFLDDFKQTVGDGVVPVLAVLARFVAFIAKGFEELGVTIAGVGASVVLSVEEMYEKIKAVATLNFDKLGQITAEFKAAQETNEEEYQQSIADIEARFNGQRIDNLNQNVQLHAKASEEQTRKEEEENRKRKAADDKAKADAKAALEKRKADFSNFLSFTSSLQNSKNKEMAAIGKAAAIGETTINTYRAATGAYAALAPIPVVGPALGAAAAAAAITAGLANVAKISGIAELEEGGVTAASGPDGVRAKIGEKGKREGVLPLQDPTAMRHIVEAFMNAGLAGGGGPTTIFYNTFVLPGIDSLRDPRTAQEIFEICIEQMRRQTPEAVTFTRVVADLAEVNRGRSA